MILLQARATLQSLKDYYSVGDDGILDEVSTKLGSLDEAKTVTTVEKDNQQNKEN